ncbi:hypothetical protein CEV33_1502 [Brucella grignonensis]|uniref:Uncharacterized protein n=1 Tax=Brucella grignonensis TaxID=94627 RepID=A0A256FAP2_9HYPH|nr:hypothetical protein CEV33_1502 [Brucella grignonensis]
MTFRPDWVLAILQGEILMQTAFPVRICPTNCRRGDVYMKHSTYMGRTGSNVHSQ